MKGKVAIVTGSSSGIGAGIAQHLLCLGARVTITGRREEMLKTVRDECVEKGANKENILIVPGDLTSLSFLDKLISDTISKFGQLDYLINNAGVASWLGVKTTTEKEYDLMMNTNIKAPMFLIQKAIPHLAKTKGCIVNISSAITLSPNPMMTVYAMTKAAMDIMTKCLASDLSVYGIRINAILPGMISTPILDKARESFGNVEERVGAFTPVARAGEVHEIANLVAFVCDPKTGGFITGSCLQIDGGLSTMPKTMPGIEEITKKVLGHPSI